MLSLHYLADDWMNHLFITIYHGQTSTNQVINSQDAERAKEDMLPYSYSSAAAYVLRILQDLFTFNLFITALRW